MSFIVRAQPARAVTVAPPPVDLGRLAATLQPQDVGSFMWGMVAGGIVMVVVGGVVLYFTWPAFVGFLKMLGLWQLIGPQFGM